MQRKQKHKLVISDNFQTFKSAELKNFLQSNGIEWELILEKSHWWDGSTKGRYDMGMIGITKSCLEKVMGKALLTFEELRTIVTEIQNALKVH